MNIQLIVCHPNLNSFNHAIAEQVTKSLSNNGHTVNFHDLYQENFGPVLTYEEIINECNDPLVKRHIEEITNCNGLVIIHPNWWGKPPALLSGWIDRTLRMNMAYTFPKDGEGGPPIGLLKLEHVVILNTSNTTAEREKNVFGDPLEKIWKDCVFDFCGVANVVRKTFSVVVDSSSEARKQWLKEVDELIVSVFKTDN